MRYHLIKCIPLSNILIFTHPAPNQHDGESIVIPGGAGMVFQVLSEKPVHMLVLPAPGVIAMPSLLNGRLHDAGLP